MSCLTILQDESAILQNELTYSDITGIEVAEHIGKRIQSIDGMSPVEFIQQIGDAHGTSKDQSTNYATESFLSLFPVICNAVLSFFFFVVCCVHVNVCACICAYTVPSSPVPMYVPVQFCTTVVLR